LYYRTQIKSAFLTQCIDFIARTRHGKYWASGHFLKYLPGFADASTFQHWTSAVTAAKNHFVQHGATRGRLIMPCGTGKSLTAYWIAEALTAKTILVAVPSLALIRQSVADWSREFLAHGIRPEWICVCSDESMGNLERDEFVGEVYDLGLPTHTDPNEIAALLRARSNGPRIVFTTYQSSANLAAAARKARIKFDLAILDEAHKTVGIPIEAGELGSAMGRQIIGHDAAAVGPAD
jgi:predicted helicase